MIYPLTLDCGYSAVFPGSQQLLGVVHLLKKSIHFYTNDFCNSFDPGMLLHQLPAFYGYVLAKVDYVFRGQYGLEGIRPCISNRLNTAGCFLQLNEAYHTFCLAHVFLQDLIHQFLGAI